MRISLRTLFAFTLFVAICAAVFMYCTIEYRKQLAIRWDLQRMGAYSISFGSDNTIHASFHSPVDLVGLLKYGSLGTLDLKEAHITDQSIRSISNLKSIGLIVFSLSDVRDEQFQHLNKLGQLKHLCISHTNLSDDCIDAITQIPGLQTIQISNTRLTPRGIEKLRASLPTVRIFE